MVLVTLEACAKLRTRVTDACRRDLSKIFAAWLRCDGGQMADFVSVAAQAAKREGADQDFQTVAVLGYAADAGLLSGPQAAVLKKGLTRVAGRTPVVNGVPMAFCVDAVGILGVAVGARAIADAGIINQVAQWITGFLRSSYETDGVQDWQRALFAFADVKLGGPLRLLMPNSAEIADVRTALRAKGTIAAGNGKHAREDALQTFALSIEEPPGGTDCDRLALRLAALEWVIHTVGLPPSQRALDALAYDSANHRENQLFVMDAPTPSMDRVLQTNPVWTIRGTQKTPIPLTRLGGEVVWINPSGSEEPEDPVLTAEEEQEIAGITLSARTELRSEVEAVFGGPAWPAATAIIEPFRRYAIKVYDVNAKVCRRAASARGRDFNEVLGAMARNLLSEMFGIEWEKSPGDRVVRIDWQCGAEGWTGKEFRVIAGNDPDPSCLYHELIGDAIKYRYRFHDVPPDPIPGEPPGINLSNTEWWDYIGLKERHNLAMAIQPYLEDRKLHWQSFKPLQRANDASVDMVTVPGSNAFRPSQDMHVAKESRKAKKQPRRNTKYEGIDQALAEISKARPRNHEEVFRFLDDRKIPIPNRKPFKPACGWLKGFKQDQHRASAWLSQVWGRLELPAFARGPKK